MDIRNKKVLVFGFGILGGGLATTNWLIKHGAKVTVTDLKTKTDLAPTLKKIKGKVLLKLGGHSKKDIEKSDLIVMNPDVSINNEYIKHAFKKGIPVENEATLFFKWVTCPIVGITGTRGKTTTTHWINHFLGAKYHSAIAGNSTEYQFLKIVDRTPKLDWVASEIPSFHLELFNEEMRKSDIAVVTNLYQDHLNRHLTMKGYADTKANLFIGQKQGQVLILNADNKWTPYFSKLAKSKSKCHVWFFSATGKLNKKQNGVFYKKGEICYQFDGHAHPVLLVKSFEKEYGSHNLENLLASALAAYLAGVTGKEIQSRIVSLPQIPFRQEIIFKNKHLTIVNDTTATSPEGSIAAVKRFASPFGALAKGGRPNVILIAGGTDRNLDFKNWGRVIPKYIKKDNLILLEGTATANMIASLPRRWHGVTQVADLAQAFHAALALARRMPKAAIVFSPGAKSFGLFKNEYDRGAKFNTLVRKVR
ncbi:MAG: UDP-N-acetylmuramoyl-L-alanine--D-glutamate ligase [Patescibacteria group bacterium]